MPRWVCGGGVDITWFSNSYVILTRQAMSFVFIFIFQLRLNTFICIWKVSHQYKKISWHKTIKLLKWALRFLIGSDIYHKVIMTKTKIEAQKNWLSYYVVRNFIGWLVLAAESPKDFGQNNINSTFLQKIYFVDSDAKSTQ